MSAAPPSVAGMTQILLFHHALGLTAGVLAFADELRSAGHTVHAPDLFSGRTFDDVEVGVAFAQEVGTDHIRDQAKAAAEELPADIVYAGFSLGGMAAEELALTRPGARGCLLFHTGVPIEYFTDAKAWPDDVPLEMHITEDDVFEDTPVCREIADGSPAAELVLYPGSAHLFADPGSTDYDEDLARQLTQRTLEFLARVG